MMSLYEDDMADLFGEENFMLSDDDGANGQTETNAENQTTVEELTLDSSEQTAKKDAKTKRVVKNPQPKLDPDRLCGPRGISKIPEFFGGVRLKGKGHEKDDLDLVLKKLEHWSHRLFPKLPFDDCLARIEKIGVKKSVQTYVKKIRMDMIETSLEQVTEDAPSPPPENTETAFESLFHSAGPLIETTERALPTPKQRERMEENRRKAEERKRARELQALSTSTGGITEEEPTHDIPCDDPADQTETTTYASPDQGLVDIDSMLEEFND